LFAWVEVFGEIVDFDEDLCFFFVYPYLGVGVVECVVEAGVFYFSVYDSDYVGCFGVFYFGVVPCPLVVLDFFADAYVNAVVFLVVLYF